MISKSNGPKRWQKIGFTILLGAFMTILTLFILQSNAWARGFASGAGGCGDFASAISEAIDEDTILQMVGNKPTDGVLITENLRISGGWSPNPTCTVANQSFTETIDIAAFGFSYLAPDQPSALEHDGGSVLRIDDVNHPTYPNVDKLIVENISLEHFGTPSVDGGGISGVISNSAEVLLDNVFFDAIEVFNNHNGGGLKFELWGGSHLIIEDSAFIQNQANGNAGGLFVVLNGGSRLTIDNSLFEDNRAFSGGAFEVHVNEGSEVLIRNSKFVNNSTTSILTSIGGGGLFMIDNGTVTIVNSLFQGNDTGPDGGALHFEIDGGNVTIKNSAFLSNTAEDLGGALYVNSTGTSPSNFQIINSRFEGNTPANQFNSSGYLNMTILTNSVFLPLVLGNYDTNFMHAEITGISLTIEFDYLVDFETYHFVPNTSDVHVHFFFDTVDPEYAGTANCPFPSDPDQCKWKLYGGSSPFTGYAFSDRQFGPDGAEKLCILVADADHSVRLNTGNCIKLP